LSEKRKEELEEWMERLLRRSWMLDVFYSLDVYNVHLDLAPYFVETNTLKTLKIIKN
jgi:hypothetical protein